jgi:cytochrome c oxidase accessory protein FixG
MLSALTDRKTITVTYDHRRGEPRGRLVGGEQRASAAAAGDCIDCQQCVTVCPTGIDIRDGIQLECVNCTACIDACDGVMDRVRRPRGLIRLTSEDAVRTGRRPLVTARTAAYATVWVLLVATTVTMFARMREVDVLVLRQPGTLYTTLASGEVANFYTVQALNRSGHRATFSIDVVAPESAVITRLGRRGSVEPYAVTEGRLMVRLRRAAMTGPTTRIRFAIRLPDETVQTIESAFVGLPVN